MDYLPDSTDKWFCESKLRNVVREDLLLDFLHVHGQRLGYKRDTEHYKASNTIYDSRMEFSTFIYLNRIPFIHKVIDLWVKRLNDLEHLLNQVDQSIAISDESKHMLKQFILQHPVRHSSQLYLARPDSRLIDINCLDPHILKQKIVYIQETSKVIRSEFHRNSHTTDLDAKTRVAMMLGIPIIVSPVLLLNSTDRPKNWACNPDFLIRSDIVPLLFKHLHEDVKKHALRPAPMLGLLQCHYVLLQARFVSLYFQDNAKGNEFALKNIGNIGLYKTTAYYQSLILEQVQGYRPSWALLLGRSSQWISNMKDIDECVETSHEVQEMDPNDANGGELEVESPILRESETVSTGQAQETAPENCQQNDHQVSRESQEAPARNSLSKQSTDSEIYGALYTAGAIDCREHPQERYMIRAVGYIRQAIEWWNWLSTVEASSMVLEPVRTNDTRLFPNMKNMESFPWQITKKHLAKTHYEISQLWLCGNKFKAKCFEKQIYSLTDPRLISSIPQIMKKNSKRRAMLIAILKQQHFTGIDLADQVNSMDPAPNETIQVTDSYIAEPHHLVSPPRITLHPQWRQKKVRWWVDFETTESLWDDLRDFDKKSCQSFIPVIGSLIQMPNGEMRFKVFVMKHLTMEEEDRVLQEWFEDCRRVGHALGYPDIEDARHTAFIHWSQAEPKFLYTNRFSARNRHVPASHNWPKLPFLDMLDVVQQHPVTIQGAFSFKLKAFAKALFKMGKIDVDWPSGSQCDQGLAAMTALFLCHIDSQKQGRTMQDMPLMKEIIAYNHIDCLSMFKIVEYLEKNHSI